MSNYHLIGLKRVKPHPSEEEKSAARLLAEFFHCDIEFIPRANISSADFLIKNQHWELKSPTGKGKHNIQHALHDASKQAPNVIIDVRNSKMHPVKLNHEIKYRFKQTSTIKKLLVITKDKKILEFYR